MEILLLGIYACVVWLIFIKFKLLPWNIVSQVIVAIIPIVALTTLILVLNVVAPSSAEVRVVKYVVNVVPQVRGRVIEVPVDPNRPVRKGDVLFRIDPTPYQLQVRTLEAQLANAMGNTGRLGEELKAAASRTRAVAAQLELARTRVTQSRELARTGAGDRFALEQSEANVKELQAQLASAVANEGQVRAQLGATVGEDQAEVAQVRAQLENARWELDQTTVYAPANGYAVNVQLRPGSMTAAFPALPVMTFVEDEYQILAMFYQNELHQVEPGNEAEFTITTRPGLIVKAKVDSIVWAQGQGQVAPGMVLPTTGVMPATPGRFAVKLNVDPKFADMFFPAGAIGHGAIYTEHGEMVHIIRKVILRVGAKIDYLVLKLH